MGMGTPNTASELGTHVHGEGMQGWVLGGRIRGSHRILHHRRPLLGGVMEWRVQGTAMRSYLCGRGWAPSREQCVLGISEFHMALRLRQVEYSM